MKAKRTDFRAPVNSKNLISQRKIFCAAEGVARQEATAEVIFLDSCTTDFRIKTR
jgi:hypothetical protein